MDAREYDELLQARDAEIERLREHAVVLANTERELCRVLIEECCSALSEELSARDIDPPLAHVKQAYDHCKAWLDA